jgi:hypothetical protein
MSGPGLRLAFRRALDPSLASPLAACTDAGLLHLVASRGADGGAARVAIDVEGRVVAPPRPVPMDFVHALASCDGALLASGGRGEPPAPVLLHLPPSGEALEEWTIHPEETLSQWPVPACPGGVRGAAWEMGGARASLCWSALRAESLPIRLDLPDTTAELAVTTWRGSLLFLRAASSGALSLYEIGADRTVGETPLLPAGASSPALAEDAGGVVAAWVAEGRSLHLQRFGADLVPVGAPTTLESVDGPTSIRSVRLLGGAALAVSYHTETLGDPPRGAREDGLPAVPRTAAHFVRAVGAGGGEAGGAERVDPPALRVHAGGWSGDRLLLVHGGPPLTLSGYDLVGGAGGGGTG